jgi:arabinofuranosyltransferase
MQLSTQARPPDRTSDEFDRPAAPELRERLLWFSPALIVLGYSLWQASLELPPTAAWLPGLLQLSAAVVGACALASLPRVPGLALVGLAGLLFLLFGTHVSHGLIDDSFISLRYARNFARGDGLVFNPGERVEGYTCFLWVWLLGSLHAIDARFDLVITAQVLGVLSSLAALWAMQRCARTLAPSAGDGRSILLLAGHFPLVFWGFCGMETGLCVALSTWGAFCMCRFLQRDGGALHWLCAASTLWVLAMLTRPELYLLYPAHLPFVVWRRRSQLQAALLCFAAPFALVFVPYFCWRYEYYGYPFPNTYYAKVGTPFSHLRFGASYLFLGMIPHALLLPFVARAVWRLNRRRPAELYITSMAGLLCAAILITGADHFGPWRYFAYLLPFLYSLAREDLERALSIGAGIPVQLQWPLRSLGMICACAVFYASTFCFNSVGVRDSLWTDEREIQALGDLGRYLERTTPAGAVLASPVIGAIGYYADRTLVDMLGLTDGTIAHQPMRDMSGPKDHQRFDTAYLLRRKPDRIYLFASEPDEQTFLHARHWIPAIEDLKHYFPRADYRYELLVGHVGRYALYVRK